MTNQYNPKRTLIAALILMVTSFVTGGSLVYIASWYYDVHDSNRTARVVQEICGYSQTIKSADFEEACGMAQDLGHATYDCSGYGVDAPCIVRVK